MAFNLITVTNSTKLICFGRKDQSEFKNVGISIPSTDTSRPSRDSYHCYKSHNVDVRMLAQGYCVMPSLVYPYFELDIEQDEIHKALLIIKARI